MHNIQINDRTQNLLNLSASYREGLLESRWKLGQDRSSDEKGLKRGKRISNIYPKMRMFTWK